MSPDQRAPWIIRTYAGFGNAEETNKRFHENLKSGQSGLSVAFDLPTQNGFDPDAPIARGEVGGTGVSIAHSGDMRTLLDGIDLARVNTSMTINATAPFLFALYLVHAEKMGVRWETLRGTVQNDLLKEFVARGTSIFSPRTSLRLSTDLVTFAATNVPQWNPINVCGYHYMESGARPHEEIGYAFGNALLLLDRVRPELSQDQFAAVVRRISFFINSGIELVPEICKIRAYAQLWTELCESEYDLPGVPFRAGCQVRSVSLTANQPEINIVRIALEALPAILSASSRVSALQLPGFREALSLPDKTEQTMSIRTQQILMHETRITEHGDIFAGNAIIEGMTRDIAGKARAIALQIRALGYEEAIRMIELGLTNAILERETRIDGGDDTVVGVNAFTDPTGFSDKTPTVERQTSNDSFEADRISDVRRWRENRDGPALERAAHLVRNALRSNENVMPATIKFARSGGTVGEWTTLIEQETNGRHPTNIALRELMAAPMAGAGPAGRNPARLVLAKSGLDGHTNGIKVLALALRNAGIEVIYAGTKLTPASLVGIAADEDADALAISSLAGAHLHIARELISERSRQGVQDLKIILGGIIPEKDREELCGLGIDLVVTNTSGSLSQAVTQVCSLMTRKPQEIPDPGVL